MAQLNSNKYEQDFSLEANHLQKVYQKMLASQKYLTAFIKEAREDGLAFVQKMSEDVRIDFSSFSDNMDTFSTIEMKNREIDQMNSRIISSERLLADVERSLEAPYFGKIQVTFIDDDEEDPEAFYIGINSYEDQQHNKYVYDWRSPIAELFYNNKLGASSYRVNNYTIDVNIDNRRQFVIEKDKLIKFFDTSVAIQDDVLLEALELDSSNLMQDITATIQSEQNVIIRDIDNPIILVNGVAGSGKTSTIMQRIAYLLYSFREEITSDNILILSPNEQFVNYISNVLPSLGERTPLNMTLLQFVEAKGSMELETEAQYFDRISQEEVPDQTKVIRSASFIAYLDQAENDILQSMDFIEPIFRRDKEIISPQRIMSIFDKTPESSPLVSRMQATKQLLESYWERRMTKNAQKPKVIDRVLSLPESLQQKFFNEQITDDSEATIKKYANKYIRAQYSQVTRQLQDLAWINLPKLFSTLYTNFTGKAYEFNANGLLTLDEAVIMLYIYNRYIDKISLPKMRFVLVDEVQDYTPAQIKLLASLFPQSAFTMVGDENQAIFNSHIQFNDITKYISNNPEQVKLYPLVNSYRSSGSITELFKRLATNNEDWEIIPIRPLGNEPRVLEVNSTEQYLELLASIQEELAQKPLTIITKTAAEADALSQSIGVDTLSQFNTRIIPISLSKGLEFDHVLIHNASNENYHTLRDKRILYTASSRAMKDLYITYQGQLTEMLDNH